MRRETLGRLRGGNGYALSRGKLLTLDSGHYHPTETVTDKLSSVLAFLPEVLLHVSRGVRRASSATE